MNVKALVQRIQARPQALDFIHQIQRQCETGNIDAQIAMQMHGRVHARQVNRGKLPALMSVLGFDHAFRHQHRHPFRVHAAGTAKLTEGDGRMRFHDFTDQLLGVLLGHGYTPRAARGLKFMRSAICS